MTNLRAWCKHLYLLIHILKLNPNLAKQVSSTLLIKGEEDDDRRASLSDLMKTQSIHKCTRFDII